MQKSPATFRLGASATIEASMSVLGMRQVDLVVEGETTLLTPVEGTAEAWRLQLERERPDLSRLIGVISWIVLAVALVYEVPQLIALIGGVIGADFESPVMCRERPTSYSASRRSPLPWSERCDSRAIAGLVETAVRRHMSTNEEQGRVAVITERQMVEVNLLGAMTATEMFLDQLRDGGGDLINCRRWPGVPRGRAPRSTTRPSGAWAPGRRRCARSSSPTFALAITAEDIAEVIAFAVARPRRMTLKEILIRPTAQAL